MNNNKYNQGDRVYFKLGEDKPSGWAIIEGVMGWVIILKPEIPFKDYDYTHIYVVNTQLIDPPTDSPKEKATVEVKKVL